ncbi:hypothetical protein [Streptomyces vilmorinianum]|uniref:hypothetical protein n=1 Tax=Streptomyces vilmorinianum TaxID=3051092 RepID=UPI0010FAEF43|nr:hypothetical protein [Streptomyces vilmorinianum]
MALFVVAALAVAGCTEAKEEYATPSELCGVPIDPSVLGPVLLPGEKLTTSRANSDAQTRRCDVSVDGERILTLEGHLASPTENYRATWDWQMPQGAAVSIGDEARATDTIVGAARKCAVKGKKGVFVARAERFYPKKDDAAERKAALVRFMTSYFPAAQKAADCTG